MTMTDQAQQPTDFAQKLREIAVGCRLSKKQWGVSKTLEKDQKAAAAGFFGADSSLLSASKKLIDTRDEKYRAVTALFSQVTDDWKSSTLPYPENGLRLIKREHVEAFERRIASFQGQLDQAVAALNAHYDTLLAQAEERLGSLFNRSQYPLTLDGLFAISVEYPAVEPDPSLTQISAGLYEREKHRIAARFDEAVSMAETAFAEELTGMVQHLCERLEGVNDGTAKRIADTNITNITEFFDRFKDLSIGSNSDLERLVNDAKEAVKGIKPDWLMESRPLRDSIHKKMSAVREQLDGMMVTRPKRAISFDD